VTSDVVKIQLFKTKTLSSKTKTETKTQKIESRDVSTPRLSRHQQWPYFCQM